MAGELDIEQEKDITVAEPPGRGSARGGNAERSDKALIDSGGIKGKKETKSARAVKGFRIKYAPTIPRPSHRSMGQ